MNIREEENKLFQKWRAKYKDATFVIDGCPNPDVYSSESRKIVFVLKDANVGKDYPDPDHDQRTNLATKPHPWWTTIARWCYFLQKPDSSWKESRSEITKENVELRRKYLSRHCFVQLKKAGGTGSVSTDKLDEAIIEDKDKIIEQLTLYSPNFVVACGSGDQLSRMFECKQNEVPETSSGIRYWKIEINGKSCFLIDYCHPSIRSGTKVKGLIAKGLAIAIVEIEKIA